MTNETAIERKRVFEKAVDQMLDGQEVKLRSEEKQYFTDGDFREALRLVRAIRAVRP